MIWRVVLVAMLVTVLAVLGVAVAPHAQEMAARAARLGAWGWLLATCGMTATYVLRAGRLHAEWKGRRELQPLHCLRVILMHTAAVNLLPMRSGELGYPLMLNRRWNIPLADAASSLAWMRLQDMAIVAWLGSMTALAVLWQREMLAPAWAVAAALAATGGLVGFAFHAGRWAAAAFTGLQRLARPLQRWPRLHRLLDRGLTIAAQGSARTRGTTWAWCVGNWLTKLSTVAALLVALAGLPAFSAWCGAIGGDGASALPLQPAAGFGTYEAGVAVAARLSGVEAWREVLAAALTVHLFMLATSVLGAGLAWLFVSGTSPAAAAPVEARGDPAAR